MNYQEYRKNRSRFSAQELSKHRGQWVAFSADGRRIIAGSSDLAQLDSLVLAAGEDPQRVALEKIELEEDGFFGGAESL